MTIQIDRTSFPFGSDTYYHLYEIEGMMPETKGGIGIYGYKCYDPLLISKEYAVGLHEEPSDESCYKIRPYVYQKPEARDWTAIRHQSFSAGERATLRALSECVSEEQRWVVALYAVFCDWYPERYHRWPSNLRDWELFFDAVFRHYFKKPAHEWSVPGRPEYHNRSTSFLPHNHLSQTVWQINSYRPRDGAPLSLEHLAATAASVYRSWTTCNIFVSDMYDKKGFEVYPITDVAHNLVRG